MSIITLGSDGESADGSRLSAIGKLVAGAALLGGAVAVFKGRSRGKSAQTQFSEDWGYEPTKPIPYETNREVVFGKRR